ncbi:MAG: FAD-dependent oxidoreductase [Rhodoferax sp.]|nr:FAD-dependent oxidoreductase [Rhodoferax sp.]
MIRLTELKLPLDHQPSDLATLVHARLSVTPADVAEVTVFKRSVDARKATLFLVCVVDVRLRSAALEQSVLDRLGNDTGVRPSPDMQYRLAGQAPLDWPQDKSLRPVVVGFGPCGIFTALMLARMGFKPIVLERGKAVRERTKDTWALWRKGVLQEESNVQFGEGGAGTFSDGKLWSQIRDPQYLGREVMREFVRAGAPEDILVDAHPHIGTFKLVKVVENMREQLIALGGEVRFGQRLVDLDLEPCAPDAEGRIQRLSGLGVLDTASGTRYRLAVRQLVLALGHSARDTFGMLFEHGVAMEAKAFSIGFRIEHPQGLIDRARWGRHAGHPALSAAEYKLVHHAANGRSVYSFCMCPGGTVVAATSEPGHVVTNGMSQYSRNERNANAGIVVGITPDDFPVADAKLQTPIGKRWRGAVHPLAGIVLQRRLESGAFALGGASYCAPGQLVGDFLRNQPSATLGSVEPSYKPGVSLGNLAGAMPAYVVEAIREALPVFGRQIKGFDQPDAVLTGVETRTSSPLRINRAEDFQSLNIQGLYPAGEGAGYAGGILSGGVDGIRVAQALARSLLGQA